MSRLQESKMRFASLTAVVFWLLSATTPVGAQSARRLLESRESLYNNIFVYQNDNYVSMTFGHNRKIYTESVCNINDDRELPVTYTRYMTVGLAYPKKINRILEIGFGGGRTAWYLHRFLPKVPVTSVELDPTVLELARKYFGIKDEPNFSVSNADGRIFLKKSTELYDIIFVDAYRGPFVPFHLLTKEFYALVKSHLAEGGVLVQNVEPSTMLFDSAVVTINSVFPQLDIYPAEGNVVMTAYNGEAVSTQELQHNAEQRQNMFHFRYDLAELLAQRRHLDLGDENAIDRNAKLLTDDFAPVETLKAIERKNRKWPDR